MQWKGPYEVLEHVREYNHRINIQGKPRLYHANLLKQYVARTEADDVTAEPDEAVLEAMAAAILDSTELDDAKIHTFQPERKETWRDVDVSPELSSDRQDEVNLLLRQFSDIFTDVPNRTDLGEHQIR
jgi:hypothetical protein